MRDNSLSNEELLDRIEQLEMVVTKLVDEHNQLPHLITEIAKSHKKIMDRVNMWPYIKLK